MDKLRTSRLQGTRHREQLFACCCECGPSDCSRGEKVGLVGLHKLKNKPEPCPLSVHGTPCQGASLELQGSGSAGEVPEAASLHQQQTHALH